MGFAALFSEQRSLTRSLEDKVRERTRAAGLQPQARRPERHRQPDRHRQPPPLRRGAGQRVAACAAQRPAARAGPARRGLVQGLQRPLRPPGRRRLHAPSPSCSRPTVRRQGDLVARYGGEEFALIAPAASAASAQAMAQAICTALQGLGQAHALSPLGVVTRASAWRCSRRARTTRWRCSSPRPTRPSTQAKARGRNQVVLAGSVAVRTSPSAPHRYFTSATGAGSRPARSTRHRGGRPSSAPAPG